MKDVQIREVLRTDNEALSEMIRAVFVEHDAPRHGTVYSDPTTDNLFELFRKEGSILWVAVLADEIVGCCGVYPTRGLPEKHAELVKYYLASQARGKGIGKDLMQQCVASARLMGYTHLYLESLPHFAKAVNIYEKQGFLSLNQPLGNSEHPTCNIWMIKNLTESD
jgi:putative acetyltransferase